MIGDTRNRCDLVSAKIGIFDSQVYFVLEVNSTPDTFHKVYNDEQEYGGTSGWCRDLSVGLQ
jgi:hypothetical protein